jgi:hypothetical protein
MSMSRSEDADDTVRKRSGWWIPLGVFLVIVVLSLLFLLYYLAPTPPPLFSEQESPTSSTEPVTLEIGGLKLRVPQNYLRYDSARMGGRRREIALFAMLPDLSGWSNWDAQTFVDDGPRSRLVRMEIREDPSSLGEAEKLRRIYLAYVADPKPAPDQFELQHYAFRGESGYHNQDLFVGPTPRGPAVMRCERITPENASPNCYREMPLPKGAELTYRFKRSKLNHWREIDEAANRLMAEFEKPPGK